MVTKRNELVVTLEHTEAAAEWSKSDERLPVFAVTRPNPAYGDWEQAGGSDTQGWESRPEPELVDTYTMPANPNPGLALAYLKMARRQGADVAMSWLIEEAVGEAGYDALAADLAGYEGDAGLVLRGIVEKIQTISMGGLEAPKG